MFMVCGTIKVEDTAKIWMLTSAEKQKVPVSSKCYRQKIMSPNLDVSYLFIYVYISIIFLHSLVDLVTASHNHI